MSFLSTTLNTSAAWLLAAGLLAACGKERPVAPVVPPTETTTPEQYGTPFAGVPERQDAVIYQVNMRAFSQSGSFAGVTARLDSIRALGANVVYLMPIFPIGAVRGVNSPYAVRDYRAVSTEFGTLASLRALVDGAHQRNMAVVLDWVANHTSWDHAWIAAHPDWYLRDAAGNILSPPNTTYTDVAQLNFNSPAMRLEMISAMKSWVYTANVDGFRFDYADAPPVDFWQQATDTLRAIRTHRLLLLAEGSRNANFNARFDYNFGFGFYEALKRVYRGGAATQLDATHATEYSGATGTQQVVRYTTNHDVNGSDGPPVNLFGGHAGAMSAFVIAACYRGVPMIYNGQEAGMTAAIPFPFTGVKVQWGARPDVTRAYQRLLATRAGSTALRTGTPTSYSSADVCALHKTAGTEQALVLVNVRSTAVQYTLPAALSNSSWTDAERGSSVALGTQVSLPPYGYLLLKR
ncbi:hypothetical protein EJV47_12740 [Hymenobacter gummosus]|uniref:Glycosyl hydrolase family 13 catalytic domain-containing protein n=1 Tax=Hymenobacter gummosus TaxID=1776032 RepID=A0A3S0H6G6_9BACT|nr:alpha-amylase family glycosyl hydrolase [Hymenobacter gummosus]RTQ49675.1 hypothetical protein EJV47_12740 [Hymenobacter gummosus]